MTFAERVHEEIITCLAYGLSAHAITRRVMAMFAKRHKTVAVRICSGCEVLLGEPELWDGYDGEAWLVTHGMCNACLAAIERECAARDAEAAA